MRKIRRELHTNSADIRCTFTEESEFESRSRKEFSLLYSIQTGYVLHPTSYPMGTQGSFPEG
jgi:hypothetical protein